MVDQKVNIPMDRRKKLKLNTIAGLVSQVVTLICGFIVPRLILSYYGSDVNGLVSSITHFLSFISLAECGMGVVIQSSLYKPLAEQNEDEISRIIISSDRFFRTIGIVFSVYVIILAFSFPFFLSSDFDFWYISSLLLAIAISTYVQHFICMSYRLLISADQLGYIQLSLQIITQILSTVLCVVLFNIGASIQVLKLCTSITLFIQPAVLAAYVKKHYKINKKLRLQGEPIKQKWNGLAQHVAYVVLQNTDTVVLTLMSTLTNVSIYNVYYLVVNGIKAMLTTATTGMQSFFGNLYAKNESEGLNIAFSLYEWLMHTGVVFLYVCTASLIVSFVQVYTTGIEDADYIVPAFGILISIAQMSYCIRIPYNSIVFAAGHYKQTQTSAIIEAVINIIVSVTLVSKFGLVGVAVGTLAAMTYRTVYLAWYLSKNILYRPIKHFIKHIAVDILAFGTSYYATVFFSMESVSYTSWLLLAVKVFIIDFVVTLTINVIAYPKISGAILRKCNFLKRRES